MCHRETHKHPQAAVQPHLAPLGSTRGGHDGPWGLTNLQTTTLVTFILKFLGKPIFTYFWRFFG